MAKRSSGRTPAHLVPYQFRPSSAPAPVVIRQTRTVTAKHKKGGRRRHGQGSPQKTMMGIVIGGLVLGFVDKQLTNLPTIPMLGKAGTIAVGAYFLGRQHPGGLAMDVAKAAAAIAAYQMGSQGHVSGDDVGNIAAQV